MPKEPDPPKTKQEKINKVLIDLASKGRLTPDDLIKDARYDKKHPCHGDFNWNVEEAAMEHWRDVARRIITSYTVEYVTNGNVITSIPYFVHDLRTPNEQGYVSLNDLKNDADRAREYLQHEGRLLSSRFLSWIAKAEILGMMKPLQEMQKELQTFLDRLDEAA